MFTTFVVSEPKDIMTTLDSKEPTITLVSIEGIEMEMNISAAAMSNILNETLIMNDDDEENGEESNEEKIKLPIKTAVLEKVIEYCNYHSEELAKTNTYYKRSGRATMRSTRAWTPRGRNRPSTKKKTVEEIEKDTQEILAKKWAKWDRQFIDSMFSIFSYFAMTKDSQRRNRTMLFDLLLAANFLDIKSLLDLTCVKVASMIQKDIGGDIDTTDLIYTLPVEMQLQIYSHRTYAQHAQLADKFKAQSAAIQAQSAALAETIEYRIKEMAEEGIRVPQDCSTLEEAVKMVHDNHKHPQKYVDQDGNPRHLNKIVVGKGEHQIDGDFLLITSATNIEGNPGVARKDIVIMGGIKFKKGIQGNCHLQHLTLRQAILHGVGGESSFTMEDVLVEQCEYYGVWAFGTGVVGRCTNVEVRQCGMSGVNARNGASITLIGAKTTVHHNCTSGDIDLYGLQVGSSSTIQLISPLTKEQVSLDNGGGGNWGAYWGGDINQIKTITE